MVIKLNPKSGYLEKGDISKLFYLAKKLIALQEI